MSRRTTPLTWISLSDISSARFSIPPEYAPSAVASGHHPWPRCTSVMTGGACAGPGLVAPAYVSGGTGFPAASVTEVTASDGAASPGCALRGGAIAQDSDAVVRSEAAVAAAVSRVRTDPPRGIGITVSLR